MAMTKSVVRACWMKIQKIYVLYLLYRYFKQRVRLAENFTSSAVVFLFFCFCLLFQFHTFFGFFSEQRLYGFGACLTGGVVCMVLVRTFKRLLHSIQLHICLCYVYIV